MKNKNNDKKKSKSDNYLDRDFINTSFGPLMVEHYKSKKKKDKE